MSIWELVNNIMAIPTTSPPVILRSKHYASNYFGSNNPGTLMASVPRVKFMYYVNFVPSSDAMSLFTSDLSNLGSTSTQGLSFKVQSIDKPKVEMATTELNQYNRKRYAYTKVTYQPVTVKLFDTVDDTPLRVWIDYFTYYFGDSRSKNSYAFNQSVVDPTFFDSSGWGLRPVAERLNFFDRIELYTLFGQTYSQVNYINPKIISVDWGGQDSADSGLQELSMQYHYESLQYVVSNAPITSSLATQFGFEVDYPTIEVDGALNFGNQNNTSNNGSIAALTGLFAGASGVSVYSLEAEVGAATGLLNGGLSSLGSELSGSISGLISGSTTISGLENSAGNAISTAASGVGSAISSTANSLGGFASGFGL
jgi:hypothetical protein